MQNDELISDLTAESLEHVAEIEADILSFEEYGMEVPAEILNRVFRDVHSIKGGFSFFGFENIKSLSHSMETVLGLLREEQLNITHEIVEALLEGVDRLKDMLLDLGRSESVPIDKLLKALEKYSISTPGKSGPGEELPEVIEEGNLISHAVEIDMFLKNFEGISLETFKAEVKQGKTVFEILWPLGKQPGKKKSLLKKDVRDFLVECETVGTVFNTTSARDSNRSTFAKDRFKKDCFHILFSTILSSELIFDALEIPRENVHLIDISDFKQATSAEKKSKISSMMKKSRSPDEGITVSKTRETLRVKVDLLNNLMNLAGELVLGRNQLFQKLNGSILDGDTVKKSKSDSINNKDANVLSAIEALKKSDDSFTPNQLNIIERNLSHVISQIHSDYQQILETNFMEFSGIKGLFGQISMITSNLQDQIMKSRMQSVGVVFNKFPRVVRDLAKLEKKEISLKIYGSEVEMDKTMIEMLSDPMTHLVRNCIDHGIETPEVRKKSKKLREGLLELRAFHSHGKISIIVEDDGAGIDAIRVKEKALSAKIVTEEDLEQMNDNEIKRLIFKPGFSTSDRVSDLSGRGVGMDVVKTNIEQLGGTIFLESQMGRGTRFTLQLPLTLAIFPALILVVEDAKFALPQSSIEELVEIKHKDIAKKIEKVHGADVFRLRGKLLPLVRLADILEMDRTYLSEESDTQVKENRQNLSDRRLPGESLQYAEKRKISDRRKNPKGSIIINVIQVGNYKYGLIVDSVLNNEEIVVKPLSKYLSNCTCYSGSTILGDGNIAMILDTLGISKMANINFSKLEKDIQIESKKKKDRELLESQDMLGFKAGGDEIFAISLSMVSRIEKINLDNLQASGDVELLKYGDHSIRVVRLHEHLPVAKVADDVKFSFLIIPKLIENPMGILATELKDVIDVNKNLENNLSGQGIFGTSIMNNNLIMVLDVYSLFEKIDPDNHGFKGEYPKCRGKKVMLVDDSGFFRGILTTYLTSLGCEVVVANDGIGAWEKISKDFSIDLLVTDINMPGMDGFELTTRVRGMERLQNLPVIALTSMEGTKFRQKGMEAGVNAYEIKFNKTGLARTLEGLL